MTSATLNQQSLRLIAQFINDATPIQAPPLLSVRFTRLFLISLDVKRLAAPVSTPINPATGDQTLPNQFIQPYV